MCGGDDGTEGEDGEEWEGRQGALYLNIFNHVLLSSDMSAILYIPVL